MPLQDTTKTCSGCGETKPATPEYFARDKRSPNGFQPKCKACNHAYYVANKERAAEYGRARYDANKEQIQAQNRASYAAHKDKRTAYREANKERRNEQIRAWHEANKEHEKEYSRTYKQSTKERRAKTWRAWYIANRDHVFARAKVGTHIRRARKRNAEGTHTANDIAAQYERQKGKCYYCAAKVGDTFHIDHVVPLSRGGSNGPENLVIACPPCNLSKRDKLPHEWAQGGRLL